MQGAIIQGAISNSVHDATTTMLHKSQSSQFRSYFHFVLDCGGL